LGVLLHTAGMQARPFAAPETHMNNMFSFDNFALTFIVGLIVFCWVVFLTVLFA